MELQHVANLIDAAHGAVNRVPESQDKLDALRYLRQARDALADFSTEIIAQLDDISQGFERL